MPARVLVCREIHFHFSTKNEKYVFFTKNAREPNTCSPTTNHNTFRYFAFAFLGYSTVYFKIFTCEKARSTVNTRNAQSVAKNVVAARVVACEGDQ